MIGAIPIIKNNFGSCGWLENKVKTKKMSSHMNVAFRMIENYF